jgi:hypothetical protein
MIEITSILLPGRHTQLKEHVFGFILQNPLFKHGFDEHGL